MKKTLVALAVAATAATAVSTANAFVVYENDGSKVELDGSFRAFLGRLSDGQRTDLVNDGTRIQLKASQDLDNGLSAFLRYDLRFKGSYSEANRGSLGGQSGFGNPTTDKIYAGLKHADIGSISLGRSHTNADDVLQDGCFYNSAELAGTVQTKYDKSIRFTSKEWNGFKFGLDYGLGDPNKADANVDFKYGYGAAAFYNHEIADDQSFDVAAAFTQNRYDAADTSKTVTKENGWLTHFGYKFGPLSLGLNYGQKHTSVDGDTSDKVRYSLVEVKYQVTDKSGVYSQWERRQEKDNVSKETINKYLIGTSYELHKNVITYVQYAHKRGKEVTLATGTTTDTAKDNEFGLGLRVFF